ncbi:uncharacterized protein METZ01_LOCUS409227, partial [marine metagenome]
RRSRRTGHRHHGHKDKGRPSRTAGRSHSPKTLPSRPPASHGRRRTTDRIPALRGNGMQRTFRGCLGNHSPAIRRGRSV